MKKKMGRPRLSKRGALAEVFSVRLLPGEAKEVKAAIVASGESRSEWLRRVIVNAARTT